MLEQNTKVIYRIENPTHMHGMWYTQNGEFDPIIHELCPNALAREFPMPFDEYHSFNNKTWYSAAKSIENMYQWFNRSDAENLLANGFSLFKFVVTEWREFEYEVHFTREGVVEQQEIDIDEVWNKN